MNVGDIFYRYDFERFLNKDELYCSEYKVTKITPKGCFVSRVVPSYHTYMYDDKHFILTSAKKKFCYPTKKEALYSFRKRKERQISILESRLKMAKSALALGEGVYYENYTNDDRTG